MPYSACAYENSQFCYNYGKETVNHNLQTMNDTANHDTCIVMTKGSTPLTLNHSINIVYLIANVTVVDCMVGKIH